MKAIAYRDVEAFTPGWWIVFGFLAAIICIGLGAAYYMEHSGHWVTGMSNQVVWGMPHVFAIFLIVAASGALNVASIGSVFGKTAYKPLAPLSALMAIALLAGGLMVLVLDLGRADRLVIAMTHLNFKSIFAWNVLLYNGFFAVVLVYIWMMMDRKLSRTPFYKAAAITAFVWRLILTTGTGSIFGFLVAREAYGSAIMAPLFIAMSFAFGLAFFLLVLMGASKFNGSELGDALVTRIGKLLGLFVAGWFYFVVVQHLTALYWAERQAVEAFILVDGGIYTFLFWGGQILLGTLLPLILIFGPALKGATPSRGAIATAASLVIVGGFASVYVILIGGQAYPLELFPGYEVSSSFFDGEVASYSPSLPEILLGFAGVALALVIVAFGSTVLRFLPQSLADNVVDPHLAARKA